MLSAGLCTAAWLRASAAGSAPPGFFARLAVVGAPECAAKYLFVINFILGLLEFAVNYN